MKKDIIEMLNLQGMRLGKMSINEREVMIEVGGKTSTDYCPYCLSKAWRVHQRNIRVKKHGKIFGRLAYLYVSTRRFYCTTCKKAFTEYLPGLSRRRTTSSFEYQAIEMLQRSSFSWVSQQMHISPSTLVKRLLDLNRRLTIDWDACGEQIRIGIDEHSFRGKRMVMTITDLTNKKLLAILRSDAQEELDGFFKSMPESAKSRLLEICTDLRFSYRSVVERMFPKLKMVADRFHVERQAKMMLDEVRGIVQTFDPREKHIRLLLLTPRYLLSEVERAKLETIFEHYGKFPVLKEAWLIRQNVSIIYHCSNRKNAEKQFDHCIMLLETAHKSIYFTQFKKTLLRWREQILNYYDYRTTNGFTEGCHTKIKLLKRISYGFRNVDNYIAKMMLAFAPLLLIKILHTY